jgi:plasmid maintenance system antidote protein VapI
VPKTASEVLKAAIASDGRAPHGIAKQADVPPTTVSRWLRGERGMLLETADKLAAELGLELRKHKG